MPREKQEIADDIHDLVVSINKLADAARAAGLDVEFGNRSLPKRELVVTISEPQAEPVRFERAKKEAQ